VGKWFKGISPELAKALLDRCEAYRTLDKLPTTWGSLLQPEVLARVDVDILLAAQEVHGEQQVAFLGEIADAYRAGLSEQGKIVNIYEDKAQKMWLDENPLLVIARDENLNHASIEEAAQMPMPMPTQRPTQMSIMPEPELEEESILIPEEEEEKEADAEAAEAEKTEGREKKTIRFNL